jgi:hypothetical protein
MQGNCLIRELYLKRPTTAEFIVLEAVTEASTLPGSINEVDTVDSLASEIERSCG